MYVDNNLVVSGSVSSTGVIAGQAITGAAGNTLSTNTIDLLQQKDIGAGNDLLKMNVVVLVAAAGGTSVEFRAIAADDSALSSNVTQIGTTGAIAEASVTATARFEVELNTRIKSLGQRYLGAQVALVGASTTAGTYFIFFGTDTQDGQKFYPSGFSVS